MAARRRSVGAGLLLLLLSAAAAGGAGLWAVRSLERTARTQGVVVGIEQRDGDDGVEYAAVVEFRPGDQAQRFTDAIYSSSPPSQVGDLVTVAFDADDVGNAAITSGIRTAGRWIGIIALSLLALGLFVAAVGGIIGR